MTLSRLTDSKSAQKLENRWDLVGETVSKSGYSCPAVVLKIVAGSVHIRLRYGSFTVFPRKKLKSRSATLRHRKEEKTKS